MAATLTHSLGSTDRFSGLNASECADDAAHVAHRASPRGQRSTAITSCATPAGDLAVFDLLAIAKGLVGFAAGLLAPSAKRRLAERGAGRSDREVDTAFLRSDLAVTLDLISGLGGNEAWWREQFQSLQRDFITPDFLTSASRREWLQLPDVRSDLLDLAENRIMGHANEDRRAVDRLSASYQARTGEAASLARGAIDLVIAMMMAGYSASLRSGGSQTALAGLMQGAHRASVEGHAEIQERLALLPSIGESIARVETLLAERHSELRIEGRLTAVDLATAFAANTRAARVRPEIPGVGQIARPEIPALMSAVARGPTLLLGRGGAGKSGLVSLLVDQLQSAGQSVLLLDASLLPQSATNPQDIGDSLVEPLAIDEAIQAVACQRPVTFIVDQLDTVAGTNRGNATISLLRAATGIGNVQVLAVSRTFQAERSAEIAALGFQQFDADELSEGQAHEALHRLGMDSPHPRLVELARNLLDLSLIASLLSKGVDVLPISGEIALWEQYRLSLEREHPAALDRAVEIAWRAGERGSQSIAPALINSDDGLAALQSRGVLDATPARLRLRHERIRDYLIAWDAARNDNPLSRVIDRLPREALLGVLRWLHLLLHSSDADLERDLVTSVLGNDRLSFDLRAVVLEVLKVQTDPHQVVASALVRHLTHGGHAQFFYADLDASWLVPLARAGGFTETPSEPAVYWSPLVYLRAQANSQPEAVTQVFESVNVGSAWVIGDILEVATQLPPAMAARVVARVAAAIPDPRRRQIHNSRTAARLAAVLAREGHVGEALGLIGALLEPFSAGQSPLTNRPQVRTPLDVHEARECLRIALPALMDADSGRTRQAFEELFEQALAIDPEDDGALAYINRRAVEDNDQGDFGGSVGVLLAGLRDSAERWCRDEPAEACGLAKRYIAHRHWLLRRLGLHLLRLNRHECDSAVEEVLTDEALLSPNAAYHEVYLLLEAAYGDLPDAAQAWYLEWVERRVATMDLKDYPDELHDLRRLGRTRRLLWPIRAYLDGSWKQRLDAIVVEYGEENPDLQGYITAPVRVSWGGDDTTETEERLRGLSLDELVEELSSAEVRDDPFGPGAAVTAFGHLVQQDPQRFGMGAPRFIASGLHARFASELLEGLANTLRSQTPVPWDHVLEACRMVAARGARPSVANPDEDESASWRDAQRAAIDLLALGLGTQAPAGLPDELGDAARDLLITLLAHPDPGPERDADSDPLQVAINSARGRAIDALIAYAARRAGRLKLGRGERLEAEVRATLDRHVDPETEGSPAVHSMFGWHFQSLLYLDEDWVRSHLDQIFPSSPSLGSHWDAAWAGYLLNTPVYREWYEHLEPQYRRGLQELATIPRRDGHYLQDARRRLVQSIVLAYLEGWESYADTSGRLALLLGTAPEDMLAEAFDFVGGELVRRAATLDDQIWQRVALYWERRVLDAEGRDAVTKEFQSLWRLLPGIPVPLPDVTELIERTIARTALGWEIHQTIEYLAEKSERFPREAARLLATLEIHTPLSVRAAFHISGTEKILGVALKSGDAKAAEFARQFINGAADKSDTRFFRLLRPDQA